MCLVLKGHVSTNETSLVAMKCHYLLAKLPIKEEKKIGEI